MVSSIVLQQMVHTTQDAYYLFLAASTITLKLGISNYEGGILFHYDNVKGKRSAHSSAGKGDKIRIFFYTQSV